MDNGREFDLAGPAQTALRAHASVFTSSLNTSLMIKNDGSTPLVVRPKQIRMLNRAGNALRLKRPVSACPEHGAQDELALAVGASCRVRATFEVTPDADKLKTVTMIHDGVVRNGVAVAISVSFEKD